MKDKKLVLKNKNFLFVNLAVDGCYEGVNQGIAILVPIIKKFSYTVKCLDIRTNIDPEDFYKQVLEFNPSIVAFSFIVTQQEFLKKYSQKLTNSPDILQIAGGSGITLDYEKYLNNTAITGACIGEGEVPLYDLLTRIEKNQNIHETPGFYWKNNETIIKNKIPNFIADISSLDFPDYSVFNESIVISNINQIQVKK